MKKTLQHEMKEFFTVREGKLHRLEIGDIDWLLEAANDAPHLEDKKYKGRTVRFKNGKPISTICPDEMFCYWVKHFIDRLLLEGVTEQLTIDLNDLMNNTRYIHILSVSRGGEAYWQNNIADMSDGSTPDEVAAYAFSHHLAAGGLNGLKRCKNQDCRKFFAGRPNSKWCSKACGSKHRVQMKRKRDKT